MLFKNDQQLLQSSLFPVPCSTIIFDIPKPYTATLVPSSTLTSLPHEPSTVSLIPPSNTLHTWQYTFQGIEVGFEKSVGFGRKENTR